MMRSDQIFIPIRLFTILQTNKSYEIVTNNSLQVIESIIKEGDHFFFGEFTDHGIDHINQALLKANDIITDKALDQLDSKNISILIIAIALHDIGMSVNYNFFKHIIGPNNNYPCHRLDKKPYNILWGEYLEEYIHWNNSFKINLYGKITDPNLENLYDFQKITDIEKKFIGEFIRRHHPRIAHDIVLNYYPLQEDKKLLVVNNSINELTPGNLDLFYEFQEIVGLIARSHGYDFREITDYLKSRDNHNWMNYLKVKTAFLMAVIRIADYLLIDSKRITSSIFLFKNFYSPISLFEFIKHNSIIQGAQSQLDPETYRFMLNENISNDIYVSAKQLFKSIQNELDKTWALLGEAYSLDKKLCNLHLSIRRISSNLFDESFGSTSKIVFGEAKLELNKNILPLLSKRLYSNRLASIREILQNAIDACKIRLKISNNNYNPEVNILVDENIISIEDNGIGMNLYDINEYLLKVGNTSKAKKYKIDNITGRFGIGFLAGFILGDSINYFTRKYNSINGYSFTLTIADDMMKNINILKSEEIEIGTKVVIPVNRETFDLVSIGIKTYFDYCGGIVVKSNYDFGFVKFIFSWREIIFDDIVVKWTYKRKKGSKRLSNKSNYLNDFLIQDFNIKTKGFLNDNMRYFIFNIIDNKENVKINLSRENGQITLNGFKQNEILKDIIFDSYLFLLSIKDYTTLKYAPSLYPPLVRNDEEDILVYSDLGYNYLSNLENTKFDYVMEYKSTIKKDIKILRSLDSKLPKILIIYTSLVNSILPDNLYQEAKKLYKKSNNNIEINNWILEYFDNSKIEAFLDFHDVKELMMTRRINSILTNDDFKDVFIPYSIEDRKKLFEKHFFNYNDRINEFIYLWDKK